MALTKAQKIRLATRLHNVFKDINGHNRPKVSPFDKIDLAIAELQRIPSDYNRKMFELYSTRNVVSGLKSTYRMIQRHSAQARSIIQAITENAVEMHCKLTRGEQANQPGRSIPVPTQADLMNDIEALERDFDNVTFDRGGLVVRTKPVTLEYGTDRVEFGRFDICFGMKQERVETADDFVNYHLKAVEPNECDGYVHPHIEDNYLCEGDAVWPIRNAIKNGFLYEFFLVVNNTVNNYNNGSPYMPLSDWLYGRNSVTCDICEGRVHEDDAAFCGACDRAICDSGDCGTWCEIGQTTLCSRCREYMYGDGRSCCRRVGECECVIHENEPCEDCDEIVPDSQHCECTMTGLSLCHACAESRASNGEPCNADDIRFIKQYANKEGICKYACKDNADSDSCMLVSDFGMPKHEGDSEDGGDGKAGVEDQGSRQQAAEKAG